jgi:hypothetical protein
MLYVCAIDDVVHFTPLLPASRNLEITYVRNVLSNHMMCVTIVKQGKVSGRVWTKKGAWEIC